MKKTLTAILAIIMLIAMSVTAFAAEYTPTPTFSGYTPYAGDDFSEEAVYERLIALENVYPTGTPHNSCGGFANMLQEAAFGYKYDGKTILDHRVHNNIDELKVGDIIHIKNGAGGEHYACVLGIKDDIITIADGNRGGKVKWGHQYTIKQLSPNGTYAIMEIASYYNEDGEVVRRVPNFGYVAPAATETVPVATTAPAETTKTTTPAAPAQTTVKETKPAATTDTIVITNTIDGEKRVVTVTSGTSNSTTKISLNAKMTKSSNGVVIIAEANNTAITIQRNGIQYTVNANETLTLNK